MALLYAAGPADAARPERAPKAACAKAGTAHAARAGRPAAEDPHDLWLVREDGTGPAHSFGETPAGAVTPPRSP